MTERRLAAAESVLNRLQNELGELPVSFAVIRVWGAAAASRISAYDSWGNAISFQKLTHQSYMLRSLGPDSRAGTREKWDDLVRHNLPDVPADLPRQTRPAVASAIFPFPVLEGLAAEDDSAAVFLYRSTEEGSRLVVRWANGILLSTHDHIEEVTWLAPDTLAYSVFGSERYSEGLYLWNIRTDDIQRAAGSEAAAPQPDLTGRKTWQSLVGRTDERSLLFRDIPHAPLLPLAVFHAAANLMIAKRAENDTFHIEPPQGAWQTEVSDLSAETVGDLFPYVDWRGEGVWSKLPLTGDPLDAIDQWQQVLARAPDSPAFPYALWFVAYLYLSAEQHAKGQNDRRILHRYALEVAALLEGSGSAPNYLRAMASDLRIRIERGEPVSVRPWKGLRFNYP